MSKSRYHYRKQRVLFRGQRVDLLSIEAEHPQGKYISRELIDHPGAVVILPLLDPKTVLLIRNSREVVQETLWELPAGTLEENEDPLTCAAREVAEETGYKADKLTPLLNFFSTPGFCNEILFTYVAEELTFVGQDLDETEKIDVIPTPLSQALQMIKEGTIHDAKTICALLYFATYCRHEQGS
jgi:ADP-ribose pyrophosphatase